MPKTIYFLFVLCILLISDHYNAKLNCPSLYHICGINDLFNCIPQEWVCDHNKDCDDGSDEANCAKITCQLDQFNCLNSDKCISKSQLCDGNVDCVDHSDESNCKILPITTTCNTITEYDCLNSHKIECIPLQNVCDKKINCSNGRNVNENCKKNMCKQVDLKNRCSHTCINKYSSFVCDCPNGMRLDADNLNCKKVDICLENPKICSQGCTVSTKGHICFCYEGYKKVGNHCVLSDMETIPYLLYLSNNGIYDVTLFNDVSMTFQRSRKLLTISDKLVTFDAQISGANLEIYSSHKENDNVLSLNILNKWNSNTSYNAAIKHENKISSKIFSWPTSFYSLAVDPVRNLVFWTDLNRSTISVFNSSSMDKHDIIITDCYNAISLVLDPISAKIFWLDLGNGIIGPRIIMANMDGSGQTMIVKSKLHKPASLVLDIENQHLYWNDLFPGSIKFLDLKSKNVKVLFEDRDFFPYSMAIYKNRIYWSDWHQNRIYSVHKISGNGLVTVVEGVQASIIRIVSTLDRADLSRKANDPSLASSCSGVRNPCNYSCLPTTDKYLAKCFGSSHQNKVHASSWWYIIIPISLLFLGIITILIYRSLKSKKRSSRSNNYTRIYVSDTVKFWEDGTDELKNEAVEVNISDSIPILATV